MGGKGSKVEDANLDELNGEEEVDKGDNSDYDEAKYGKRHDFEPDFRGPVKDRGCTDILCLLLFIVFLCGWIGIGIWAFGQGNPSRLIYPSNSFGEICGRTIIRARIISCFSTFRDAPKFRPSLPVAQLLRCAWKSVPPKLAVRGPMLKSRRRARKPSKGQFSRSVAQG